jgi:hypothetical protein
MSSENGAISWKKGGTDKRNPHIGCLQYTDIGISWDAEFVLKLIIVIRGRLLDLFHDLALV